MAPGEGRGVGDVGEAHRAARVHLPGGADRPGLAVGEGERLLVAGGAGVAAVVGEAGVVEQAAAELYLGQRHRVVFG
jgi:hypothetical protein